MVEATKTKSQFNTITCPSCKETIMVSENSKFCTQCGSSLSVVKCNPERKDKVSPEKTANNDETRQANIELTSFQANNDSQSILTKNGVRKIAMIPPCVIQSAFTL